MEVKLKDLLTEAQLIQVRKSKSVYCLYLNRKVSGLKVHIVAGFMRYLKQQKIGFFHIEVGKPWTDKDEYLAAQALTYLFIKTNKVPEGTIHEPEY